jgi:hypothetical protein
VHAIARPRGGRALFAGLWEKVSRAASNIVLLLNVFALPFGIRLVSTTISVSMRAVCPMWGKSYRVLPRDSVGKEDTPIRKFDLREKWMLECEAEETKLSEESGRPITSDQHICLTQHFVIHSMRVVQQFQTYPQ